MNNSISIEVRRFPVVIKNHKTREVSNDTIVISKQQLQAAQLVGQSSKELIYRLYGRQGFKVLEIGTPEKKTVSVDLAVLWKGW